VPPTTPAGADADKESPLNHLWGSSITDRIAIGPQQGRKVFTLQTLADCGDEQFASLGFVVRAGTPCASFCPRPRFASRHGGAHEVFHLADDVNDVVVVAGPVNLAAFHHQEKTLFVLRQ